MVRPTALLRVAREKVTGKLLSLDRALKPPLPALLSLLDIHAEDAQWERLDPPTTAAANPGRSEAAAAPRAKRRTPAMSKDSAFTRLAQQAEEIARECQAVGLRSVQPPQRAKRAGGRLKPLVRQVNARLDAVRALQHMTSGQPGRSANLVVIGKEQTSPKLFGAVHEAVLKAGRPGCRFDFLRSTAIIFP